MLLATFEPTPVVPTPAALRRAGARHLYFSLLGERGPRVGSVDELSGSASRSFLAGHLDAAAELDADFPAALRALPAWLEEQHRGTAQAYRSYLDERQAGAPRRYFSGRAHALNFIRAVAPTKLVDGAWLYGVLPHWKDQRLAPLIRIFLEELGDGVAPRHHVLLYRQLLARYGCDDWQDQADAHFTQGAVQLALAHNAAEFLPELIGFNLGYEQLPLHLPITAYELNELDVDPYYFSLHVTIDNASTGHARQSLRAVLDCAPRVGDASEFHRRVANGYKLNAIGMGTTDWVAAFDLERELLAVLVDKAAVGALLHSDYCRVAGRTVSDWLSAPGQLPQFLAALQSAGWIERGAAPEKSRFWRLLTDEQAPMFGVFSGYEQQLIADWIAGEAPAPKRAVNRFRQRPRQEPAADDGAAAGTLSFRAGTSVRALVGSHFSGLGDEVAADVEIQRLHESLASVDDRSEALARLQGLLSPANHPTPAGLLATRLYADLIGR